MTNELKTRRPSTEEEIKHHKIVTFLKGCIVGVNIVAGKKHEVRRESKAITLGNEFQRGLRSVQPKTSLYYSPSHYRWENKPDRHYRTTFSIINKSAEWITVCHILHNRLRHNRPHTSSHEKDQELLEKFMNDPWRKKEFHDDFQMTFEGYGVEMPIKMPK